MGFRHGIACMCPSWTNLDKQTNFTLFLPAYYSVHHLKLAVTSMQSRNHCACVPVNLFSHFVHLQYALWDQVYTMLIERPVTDVTVNLNQAHCINEQHNLTANQVIQVGE